jgi:hypothetical protein
VMVAIYIHWGGSFIGYWNIHEQWQVPLQTYHGLLISWPANGRVWAHRICRRLKNKCSTLKSGSTSFMNLLYVCHWDLDLGVRPTDAGK